MNDLEERIRATLDERATAQGRAPQDLEKEEA